MQPLVPYYYFTYLYYSVIPHRQISVKLIGNTQHHNNLFFKFKNGYQSITAFSIFKSHIKNSMRIWGKSMWV